MSQRCAKGGEIKGGGPDSRHLGDFGDPNSHVSQLVAEREAVDLMPEQGTKPVNKYLLPRIKDRWLDKALEKL